MINALRWLVFGIAALAMNFPVIVTVITSFKSAKELSVNPGFWINQPTLDNYVNVLQVSDRLNIFAYFWNSLTASLIGSALAIILAFPAAYAMARGGFGRRTLLPAIVNLRAVPLIIFAIPLYMMFQWLGLLDTQLGLGLILTVVNLPLALIILVNAISDVPIEIDEAAKMDGAGVLHVMFGIIRPIVRPALITAFIFGFITAWNEFLFGLMLTTNKAVPMTVGASFFFAASGARNLSGHERSVRCGLFGPGGAGNDRGDTLMAERELQGRGGERDVVARADRFDLRDASQDVRRRGLVIVHGPWLGAGGEDAGIEGPAQNDRELLLIGEREEVIQPILLEQGVTTRQEEAVEAPLLGEPDAGLDLVHANAKCADHASAAQLVERPIGTRHRLVSAAMILIDRPVGADVDIMDENHVDAVHAEAMIAVLERVHGAIVAVVELCCEVQAAEKNATVDLFRLFRAQDATDLGRDDETIIDPVAQHMPKTMLGHPMAVIGRRVEKAHAGLPGLLDRCEGPVLRHLFEQIANRDTPEAEH